MPVLTTDFGEMSALVMVLRSLSLSEEDGGPVQAVGLGEGVSLTFSPSPPLPEPEESEPDEPVAELEPPVPGSSEPQPPALAQIDAAEDGDDDDGGDEREEAPAPVDARRAGAAYATAWRSCAAARAAHGPRV